MFVDILSYIRVGISAFQKALQKLRYTFRRHNLVGHTFGIKPNRNYLRVAVFGLVNTQDDLFKIKSAYDRQSYPNKQLFLFKGDETHSHKELQTDILPLTRFGKELEGKFDYIACLSVAHYYGANYLMDLVASARQASVSAIGKSAFYSCSEGLPIYHEGLGAFRLMDKIQADRAIFASHLLTIVDPRAASQGEQWFTRLPCLSIDAHHFCADWNGEDLSGIDGLVI